MDHEKELREYCTSEYNGQRREMVQPLDVIVFKGKWYSPITHFIRHRTSTAWTHCAIYIGDGKIAEAKAKGVIETPLSHYDGRERKVMRYRHEIHQEHVKAALDWLEETIETSVQYDFLAYLGFITGIKPFDQPDRFYCAELVPYCYQAAKIDLFNEIPAFIYPCEFVRNNNFMEVT